MSSSVVPESGPRDRTRRAILAAAASVLARDRTATLADIARAADVGRSTLHRYFPDRDTLVAATVEDCLRSLRESLADARVDLGPPREAMRRVVAAMVDLGDRLVYLTRASAVELIGDPRTLEGYEPRGGWADDRQLLDLVRRGQDAGVFDPDVSAEWVQESLYALVYTGCEAAHRGLLPRHGVTSTVIRTLENGIRA